MLGGTRFEVVHFDNKSSPQESVLLIKASKESGWGVTFYTLNAQNAGAPSSIGAAGADHIKQVFIWHSNVAENRAEKFANDYE